MTWDFNNERPIYSQLTEKITLSIVTGRYPAGSKLPSVREMAAEAGVNPNTMQRALSEMEVDGLIYSKRTLGRFITEDQGMIETAKNSIALTRVHDFLGAMEGLGYGGDYILTLVEKEVKGEIA